MHIVQKAITGLCSFCAPKGDSAPVFFGCSSSFYFIRDPSIHDNRMECTLYTIINTHHSPRIDSFAYQVDISFINIHDN